MIKAVLLMGLLLYAALAAYAWFTADSQIFYPPPASYSLASIGAVRVATSDGVEIPLLYLPNPEATLTILFSHGNAEDLGHALPFLERLRDCGFSVVAYDYRGYGPDSETRPTVEGAYRDIAAAYRYATESLGIPPSTIILFGRSVGSGPSTHLAAREDVGGLILESAFTSTFVVVTKVALLPFDRFPNLASLRRVSCPVLVVHGIDDEIIPLTHGRRLHDAAPEPKRSLWISGAGHNDVAFVGGETYWQAIREFGHLVESHTAGRKSSVTPGN